MAAFDADGDSAIALTSLALVKWDVFVIGDGAILSAVGAEPGWNTFIGIAEAISVQSDGSAPTIFFESVGSDVSASSAAVTYTLFIAAVDNGIAAGTPNAVNAVYAVSAESLASLMTGTQFVVDFTDGWAYNLNTGAASFYEGMKFNSFAMIDGDYYGCNEAGIFRLGGDKDDGSDIALTVTLGTSRLDSDAIKTVPVAYVGAQSAEPMLLTCRVEGHEYRYEFSRETAAMAPAKLKPGKGLEGTYWQIELANQNGADMTLDTLEIVTAPKSRKV